MNKLQRGDKVALIAPASGQKADQQYLIDAAIAQLSDWGLSVTISPETDSTSGYLAASDATRAQSLIDALVHPEVKATFTTRGGYGCARLIPYLANAKLTIPSPRWLIGFSDITTLHLYFTQNDTANLTCIHGPNLATEQFIADTDFAANNRSTLFNTLFTHQFPDYPLAANSQLPLDWATQPKTGGCLSLLVTSLGTSYEIDTKDKWLLIEEVGESPYKIDRMLTQLYQAGKFDHIRGLVFGELCGCDSQNINVQSVIAELTADLPCPVIHLPLFGHGAVNLAWQYRR